MAILSGVVFGIALIFLQYRGKPYTNLNFRIFNGPEFHDEMTLKIWKIPD